MTRTLIPDAVQPEEECEWGVLLTGHGFPQTYSYTWYLDEDSVGAGLNVELELEDLGDASELHLVIQDGWSVEGHAYLEVDVDGGSDSCDGGGGS